MIILMLAATAVGSIGALVFIQVTSAPDDELPATNIVFLPPAAGAPADRIGAGTREILSAPENVRILIPEGGGVSFTQTPALLWSLGTAQQGLMRAELVPLGGGAPVAEMLLQGDIRPGLYALDLAKTGGSLELGQLYEFRVIMAGETTAELIAPARGLVERRTGSEVHTAAEAASVGAWFDALGYLTDRDPSGRVRVSDRAAFDDLLTSAGLKPEELPR